MGASDDDDAKENPMETREFKPAGAAGDDPLTRNLKRVYDEVAAEPIPADWMDILNQLDAKAKGRRDG